MFAARIVVNGSYSSPWAQININGDTTATDYYNSWSAMGFSAGTQNFGGFSSPGMFAPANCATMHFYNYQEGSVSGVATGIAGGASRGWRLRQIYGQLQQHSPAW